MKLSWSQHGSFQLFRKLAYGFRDDNLIFFFFFWWRGIRVVYAVSPNNRCVKEKASLCPFVIMLFWYLSTPLPLHWYIYLIINMSFLWNYFLSLPQHPSYISSHQMSACTNCIALKLILSCEWKLWQPLLSLQFYLKSPWRNHGNKMWHQKTMTSKAAYTVIRIYWSLLTQKRYMICSTPGFSPIPSLPSDEPDMMWKPVWSYWNIQYCHTVWVYAEREKTQGLN